MRAGLARGCLTVKEVVLAVGPQTLRIRAFPRHFLPLVDEAFVPPGIELFEGVFVAEAMLAELETFAAQVVVAAFAFRAICGRMGQWASRGQERGEAYGSMLLSGCLRGIRNS
jgi:hypothetical protein